MTSIFAILLSSSFLDTWTSCIYTHKSHTRNYVILHYVLLFVNSSSLEECTYLINGTDLVETTDDEEDKDPKEDEAEENEEDKDRKAPAVLASVIRQRAPCITSGSVDVRHNWHGYLAIFHQSQRSETHLLYRISYPARRCCVSLLLYLEDQVKGLSFRMNCRQRVSAIDTRGPQHILLSPSSSQSGCVNQSSPSSSSDGPPYWTIHCNGGRILRSNVRRRLYVAASSCGSSRGLTFSYTITLYGLAGRCPDGFGNGSNGPNSMRMFISFSMAVLTQVSMYRNGRFL